MYSLDVMQHRCAATMLRVGGIAILVLLVCSVPAARAQSLLLWADEFDGTTVDPNNWEYMYGDGCSYGVCNWGNNELEWYTARPENIYVSDGMLHIVAREDYWSGHQYTSARIRTRSLADFLYGRFEARIRLPEGEGLWPAFWMLPTNSPYGDWARSGEVDIMEAVDVPWAAYGTLIYGDNWPDQVYNGSSYATGDNFADGFHVYALEWEADEMRWYVDNNLYHTVTSNTWWSAAASSNARAPFDTPFHLLLNVAVGGDWPGSPDATTQFPQEMVVDYVRVYDLCSDCPFHGMPIEVPGRLEAEDYDNGGEGVAYHDSDTTNSGGQYRSDGVDIEACDAGGYDIGWIVAGEWTEYSIQVNAGGHYDVVASVASNTTGGTFQLWLDGTPVTGDFTVSSTGGWQTWAPVSVTCYLPEGEHRLRFANSATSTGYNLDYFDFYLSADTNHDGIVDFGDVLPLMYCMTGPDAEPANPACQGTALENGDMDGDNDIDLWDAAELQAAFGS